MWNVYDEQPVVQKGEWRPIPAGWHALTIEDAGWKENDSGSAGLWLRLSAQVAGMKMTSMVTIYHQQKTGEPIPRGRQQINRIAIGCNALDGRQHPAPKHMPGNTVHMKLGEEMFNGKPQNRVIDVAKPQHDEDGQPVGRGNADAYREASQGSARRDPPADLDDEIPF